MKEEGPPIGDRASITLPFNYELSDMSHEHPGFAIVRVARYGDGALLLPELVFAENRVYRPITLDVSSVGVAQLHGEPPHASVHVNFAAKVSCIINILATDFVEQIGEDRWLYRCAIRGPAIEVLRSASLTEYRQVKEWFYVRLYHHTNETARKGILDSKEIWSSSFNYSGTGQFAEKRYTYLTSLPTVRETGDLMRIGIIPPGAAHASVAMVADQWRAPRPLSVATIMREHVAPLDLKTANVADMQYTIDRWVRADLLAPMHWIFHRGDLQPHGRQDWMEAVLPLVFRVPTRSGIQYDAADELVQATHIRDSWHPKSFIAGFGWTEAGLLAAWVERDNPDVVLFEFERHANAEALALWRDAPNYPMVGFPKSARRQFEERMHKTFEQLQERKIGRNDFCYCGSERKYKRCHGAV